MRREGAAGNAEGRLIEISNLSFFYGAQAALKDISLRVPRNRILGIMGPAQSGKTTFLRILNRLTDLVPNGRLEGRVLLDDQDIFAPGTDVNALRRRVGIVFDKPVPLPKTIYENLAFAPRLHDRKRRCDEVVERALRLAHLWDEVKDRLHDPALRLSGGQQQRLCLARTLAMEPEVILLDEPTSGLDPISTARIEDTLADLKAKYTIVLVSNSDKQIARVSDRVAFFLMGEMVEEGENRQVFTVPKDRRTEDFISGYFG
ncbi:MAG: phosphate ABC transporter ATP-binding protein [Pseudomonadota bacterium]